MNSYINCKFSNSLGFDLLIHAFVRDRRVLDSVLILNLMRECGIMPEIRTFCEVLNALIRIRRFDMVLDLSDKFVTGGSGIKANAYVYSAVMRCFCELKDFD